MAALTPEQLQTVERVVLTQANWTPSNQNSGIQALANQQAALLPLAGASPEERQAAIDTLKTKFDIDATIVTGTAPAQGGQAPAFLAVTGNDNLSKLNAAQYIANPQNWMDGSVIGAQAQEPTKSLDIETMPAADVQYCLGLMAKLGIPAKVETVGPRKVIQIVGAPNIATLETQLATFQAAAPAGAGAAPVDPQLVNGGGTQPQQQTPSGGTAGQGQQQVPNAVSGNGKFHPKHLEAIIRMQGVTDAAGKRLYDMSQLDPSNPHAGFQFSVFGDATKPLFTVKPDSVTMHKASHTHDMALKHSIAVGAMLFNGNIKLERGTNAFRAKIQAMVQEMLDNGELSTVDVNGNATRLTQITYNGQPMTARPPQPAATANAGQSTAPGAGAGPLPGNRRAAGPAP